MSDQTQRPSELGMTLIELLIVVAIIGVLASLAVYMFTRATGDAKVSEVPAVFAEFRIRQEGYHLENGSYLSTNVGNAETPGFPDPMPSWNQATDITTGLPATWTTLRFSSDKSSLFCSYVNVAGDGSGSNDPGLMANAFGLDGSNKPATNWFYMLAFCDMDNDGGDFTTFFAQSGRDGQAVHNKGN